MANISPLQCTQTKEICLVLGQYLVFSDNTFQSIIIAIPI